MARSRVALVFIAGFRKPPVSRSRRTLAGIRRTLRIVCGAASSRILRAAASSVGSKGPLLSVAATGRINFSMKNFLSFRHVLGGVGWGEENGADVLAWN